MTRIVRATVLGFLLTLGLGLIARHGFSVRQADPQALAYLAMPPLASLSMMIAGTAHQPFVRRQFVPTILRTIDKLIPNSWASAADRELSSQPILQPVLFADAPLAAWHSVLCLMVWLVAFSVFAYVLESEAAQYASDRAVAGSNAYNQRNRSTIIFSVAACLIVLPLLHNNYIYDPMTLAFSVLALSSIRRERLWELVIITALFSSNRETAFIVPGMAFFYWLHRGQPGRAFVEAALLSTVYFAVAGMLIYEFRGNPGAMAENNFKYLVHMYTHEKLHYFLAAAVGLGVYLVSVVHSWKFLPPALKSIQWFVLPWIAMHVAWGWPMEWRVFFEIYPGMLLTAFSLWSISKNQGSQIADTDIQASVA